MVKLSCLNVNKIPILFRNNEMTDKLNAAGKTNDAAAPSDDALAPKPLAPNNQLAEQLATNETTGTNQITRTDDHNAVVKNYDACDNALAPRPLAPNNQLAEQLAATMTDDEPNAARREKEMTDSELNAAADALHNKRSHRGWPAFPEGMPPPFGKAIRCKLYLQAEDRMNLFQAIESPETGGTPAAARARVRTRRPVGHERRKKQVNIHYPMIFMKKYASDPNREYKIKLLLHLSDITTRNCISKYRTSSEQTPTNCWHGIADTPLVTAINNDSAHRVDIPLERGRCLKVKLSAAHIRVLVGTDHRWHPPTLTGWHPARRPKISLAPTCQRLRPFRWHPRCQRRNNSTYKNEINEQTVRKRQCIFGNAREYKLAPSAGNNLLPLKCWHGTIGTQTLGTVAKLTVHTARTHELSLEPTAVGTHRRRVGTQLGDPQDRWHQPASGSERPDKSQASLVRAHLTVEHRDLEQLAP